MTATRKLPSPLLLLIILLAVLAQALMLSELAQGAEDEKYTLQYKFKAGESIQWRVEQRVKLRTTVGGSTQNTENAADSTKVWKVSKVTDDGQITFVHSVDNVLMRTKLPGRADTVYDSAKDEKPPAGFEQVAADIGRPLVTITMDRRGDVLERMEHRKQQQEQTTPMTIPLPEGAVAIGESWSRTHTVSVPRRDKSVAKIKTSQRYTLKKIRDGVAWIEMQTVILSVVRDPSVEAQLMQRETTGTAQFDMQRGRIVRLDLECDKRVVGHINDTSSMHYVMKFTEVLQEGQRTAKAETIGPQPPTFGPEPPPTAK